MAYLIPVVFYLADPALQKVNFLPMLEQVSIIHVDIIGLGIELLAWKRKKYLVAGLLVFQYLIATIWKLSSEVFSYRKHLFIF